MGTKRLWSWRQLALGGAAALAVLAVLAASVAAADRFDDALRETRMASKSEQRHLYTASKRDYRLPAEYRRTRALILADDRRYGAVCLFWKGQFFTRTQYFRRSTPTSRDWKRQRAFFKNRKHLGHRCVIFNERQNAPN